MSILDDLKSLDPNDPGRWPLPVRAGAVVLCFVVLSAVLFYFFVWSDQKPRLDEATNAAIADAWEWAYGSLSPGQVHYEIAWGAGHVVQADRPDLVIMAAAGLVSEARD